MNRDFLKRVLDDFRKSINTDLGDSSTQMCRWLNEELMVNIDIGTVRENINSPQFPQTIELFLNRTSKQMSIIDVFCKIDFIAKKEIHQLAELHWYGKWADFFDLGGIFTAPDSFDFYEMVMRIEDEFNLKLDSEKFLNVKYIGQSIRYTWDKLYDVPAES